MMNTNGNPMMNGNSMSNSGGMMNHSDMNSSPNAASQPYDLQFIGTMSAHHKSAIDMAEMAIKKSNNAELKTFAQKIIDDQTKRRARARASRYRHCHRNRNGHCYRGFGRNAYQRRFARRGNGNRAFKSDDSHSQTKFVLGVCL